MDAGSRSTDDGATHVRPSRCPSCHSRTQPGQDWCSLCHVDLRPRARPAPPPQDGAHDRAHGKHAAPSVAAPQAADEVATVVQEPGGTGRTEGADGYRSAAAAPVEAGPDVVARQLLAELSVREHGQRLPSRLSVLDRLDSPALRMGVGAMGIVVVMLAGLALLGGFGALL